ncbi:MAG: type IV pilus modification protein PilV [Gammaproteobacteria bacterium]|nr:type IV pilus modification protein PilV [Gammaproteobacteria bacterium]MCZ6715643.1 type IV pilus modification protein PilV [Gammaproteobacteria bacterium]
MNISHYKYNNGTQRRIRGFSLVESLVALVVLSVGLLGVARMYVFSLQNGRSALLNTQAVILAADMADRIRANQTAGIDYAGAAADFGCVEGGVDCTPTQMASNDLLIWQNEVANALPGGQATVAVNVGTFPTTFVISVLWSDVGSPQPAQYQLTVQI